MRHAPPMAPLPIWVIFRAFPAQLGSDVGDFPPRLFINTTNSGFYERPGFCRNLVYTESNEQTMTLPQSLLTEQVRHEPE